MTRADIRHQVAIAVGACEDKKAENLRLLQLDKESSSFTDFFVICSGTNPRQIQAISDEIELRLKREGNRPNQIEGYNQAEWVLMDYVDFVVHIFSEHARKYYDLERLWKSAQSLSRDELLAAHKSVHAVAETAPAGPGRAGTKVKRKSPTPVADVLRPKKVATRRKNPKAAKKKGKKDA